MGLVRASSLESPSLFRNEANGVPAPAAYETKFLLTEELARVIEARFDRPTGD